MARLTRIEGIRPKHVAALEDANITRPSQLVAHRDLQALSEQTHISLEELKDIQQKARLEVSSQKQRYSVISFFLVGVIGLVSFYTTQWVLEYDFHGDLKSTSSDSATQTRYQTAYDAYQNEEYIKAMAAIERGLKEIKDNEADYHSDFLNLQGLIYDKQGELELALEYYRKAEGVDPTNGYATNNIGAILQIQNNFESAEENYRKAIDKQPETALFHSNLGLLLYKQKRYPDAITHLHKAAELEPENHDTKVSLANAYLQNKQIQIAIDNYLELLEQGKANRDDMLYNLGLSYERLKQYPKAISYFEQIPETSDIYAKALSRIALAQSNDNNYSAAANTQEKLANLSPDDLDAKNELANFYVNDGKFEQAIKLYQEVKAAESEPKNYIYYNIGRAYMKKGDNDLAIEYFKEAVKLDDKDGESFNYLGMLYHKTKRYEDALIYFKKALALIPNETAYLYNVGLTLTDLKQYSLGRPYLEQAIEINPHYVPPYNTLGWSYHNSATPEKAFDFYKQAISLDPGKTLYQTNIVDLLVNQLQASDGEAMLKQAITEFPDNQGFYLALDKYYLKLKQTEKRLTILTQGLQRAKNNSAIRNKLAWLHKDLGNHKQAADIFMQIAGESEKPLQPYLDAAYSYQDGNLYDQSLAAFEQALKLAPDNWYAQYNRGWLLQNMGQKNHPKAKTQMHRLLQQDTAKTNPNNKWTYGSLAWLARAQGKSKQEVFDWVAKAEAIAPQDGYVALIRGGSYEHFGEYQNALQAYHQVTLDSAQLEYGYSALCYLNYQLSHFSAYDSCIGDFRAATNLESFNWLLTFSWDLYYRGKPDEAVDATNRALELFPDNPAILASQAIFKVRIAELNNQTEVVETNYQAIKAVSQTYPYYLDIELQLAHLYRTDFRQNHQDDALKVFDKIEEKFAYDTNFQIEKSTFLYQQGNRKSARRLLDKVKTVNPNHLSLLINRGLFAFFDDDLKTARANNNKALQLSPDDNLALLLKAVYHFHLNQPKDAKDTVGKLLKLSEQFETIPTPQAWTFKRHKAVALIKTRRQKSLLFQILYDSADSDNLLKAAERSLEAAKIPAQEKAAIAIFLRDFLTITQ